MGFGAGSFERLGRRIAAAPRGVVFGLLALTLALSPGVIRIEVRAPSADPDGRELFALVCDSGVWSRECLASVDSLTRALSEDRALVAGVDSLFSRPRPVADGGRLALRPLVEEIPADAAGLRRLRARANADRASLRGLVSANERAALVEARLVAGASPRDAFALVESLRERFDRPPAVSFFAVSGAHRMRELELAARSDLARATPVALVGLALLTALAFGSWRAGLWLGALAAGALVASAGLLGLESVSLGAGAGAVPVLVAVCAAATGFGLLHRIRASLRAGLALDDAVARALGSAGPPIASAGAAGALAFLALALVDRGGSRALALAGACSVGGGVALVGLGLPAALLAFRRGGARALAPRSSGPLTAGAEGVISYLDGATRGGRASRVRHILVSAGIAALATLGLRDLRGDASAARFGPSVAPERDGAAVLLREFGGTGLLRVALDAGVAGGAAEPLFLERALDFERAAAERAGIGFARSLVDTSVLPAMRATHDDDPGFAVVPPTRGQVEDAFAALAREAPERLADGLDTEKRRLALDLLADTRDPSAVAELARALAADAAARFGRPDALVLISSDFASAAESERLRGMAAITALVAIAGSAAVTGLALESAVAALVAAVPAAIAAFVVLGAMGKLGLALDSLTGALTALVAFAAAGPSLAYLSRVRELGRAGAELGVAVSLALRDVGRPIAEGALASLLFLALSPSALPPVRAFGALACAAVLCSVAASLVVLPPLVRTLRPGFLIVRTPSPSEETLSCVRGATHGGGR